MVVGRVITATGVVITVTIVVHDVIVATEVV